MANCNCVSLWSPTFTYCVLQFTLSSCRLDFGLRLVPDKHNWCYLAGNLKHFQQFLRLQLNCVLETWWYQYADIVFEVCRITDAGQPDVVEYSGWDGSVRRRLRRVCVTEVLCSHCVCCSSSRICCKGTGYTIRQCTLKIIIIIMRPVVLNYSLAVRTECFSYAFGVVLA